MLAISRRQVGLDADRQNVLLERNLIAAVHLPVVEDPVSAEQVHRLLGDELREGVEGGSEVGKPRTAASTCQSSA